MMLKKLKDRLPIFSIALIFVGYLNYHFFYSEFDIEIAPYLTTTELVFSFLPITIPFIYFVTLALLLFLGLILSFISPRKKDDKVADEEERSQYQLMSLSSLSERLKRKFRLKKKDFHDWIMILLTSLNFFISLCINLYVYLYVFLVFFNLVSVRPFFGFSNSAVSSIIWLVCIFVLNNYHPDSEVRKRSGSLIFVMVIAISVNLLLIYNRERASNLLNGKPEYNASIITEDDSLTTSGTLIYVGKTSDYLFFRDLNKKQNIIYKMDKVKRISITKIE
jgi:hypothetical protein